jgi:hypothetical protein
MSDTSARWRLASRASRGASAGSNRSHRRRRVENENFSATFGPNSPATYLNGTLLKQGELIQNYYATGHASLDNCISHVRRTSSRSGQ